MVLLKRCLREAPVAVERRVFARRDGLFGPVGLVAGTLFLGGVVTEPDLHLFIAPTAENVVKPGGVGGAAGKMGGFVEAVMPEFGVEFAVAQVVAVKDVKAAQGEVVQQFPEDRRERVVGDFGGREQ